jgi:hypothetical protein
VRAHLLPELRGPAAWVAEAVVVLDALTLIGLALGTVGLFRRWAFVAAVAVFAGVAVALTRSRTPRPRTGPPEPADPAPAPTPTPRWMKLLALGGAGLVVAQWTAQTVAGLRTGMRENVDTLWYHGPMSARFASTGSTRAVHHFDLNPVTAYYPGGTSVLHGEGILLFGRDAASPLLNMAFLGLAFLAAWAIGRRFGSVAPSVLAVAVVMGTPMLVGDLRYGQPGAEYNDVVGVALVLAAVALLVVCRTRWPGLLLAASAAGLAAGTKVSMLTPVAALTLAVVLLSRGRRVRSVLLWAAASLATGGYWYVRNAMVTGNPLPAIDLPLTPRHFEPPATSTVARHLLDQRVVRNYYTPVLDRIVGPAWGVLLLLVVAGGVVGVVRGPSALQRVLGAVVLVTTAAYLVTPVFIGDPPIFFDTTVRFAIVPLILGPLVLAAVPELRRSWPRAALTVLLAVVLASQQVNWDRIWVGRRDSLIGLGLLALAAVAWFLARRPVSPTAVRWVGLASVAVVLVGGLAWVQRDQARYRSAAEVAGFDGLTVLGPLRRQHDARIATDTLFLQYPLYGYDLSNYVQFIGRKGPHGAFGALTTCRAWKAAVNEGNYDFLLVAAAHYPVPPLVRSPAMSWAESEHGHALRPLAREGDRATAYAVAGRLDPARCPTG